MAKQRPCSVCYKLVWDLPNASGMCKKCWANNRNFKHSLETRQRLSVIANKRWSSQEERHKQSLVQIERHKKYPPTRGMLGKKHSDETKRLWSLQRKGKLTGSDNPAWRGGTTSANQKLRTSKAYKRWRTAVFERDDYTCLFCKERGGVLNADHIKPIRLYPELALEISNGRTLCLECHKTTDSYASKARKLTR